MNEHTPPVARRKISSSWTFFQAFVFPPIWMLLVLGILLIVEWPMGALIPLTMILSLSIWFVFCLQLRVVHVDDRFLYVSNYRREITIPLSDVHEITEKAWLSLRPVILHLSTPSAFGPRIRFMPKTWQAFFWSSHPIVAELEKMVAQAKAARAATLR
jgi:hypothetical protein